MLAKLQRVLNLAVVIGVIAALVAAHAFRLPIGAMALIAVAPALAHAALLALEFALMRRANRAEADDAPVAVTELLTAWAGEFMASVATFCWRQPWAAQRWPDTAETSAHTGVQQRGVLLVHGYFCNRGFWNPWLERLTRSQTPFIAVNVEPVFGSIGATAPIIEDAVQRLERATGLPPVVIAHSMGGLVVRHWWASLPTTATGRSHLRIHHLFTLGTPHHGTWLAHLGFTRNARQMRPGSPWLQQLASREPAAHRSRITCLYSRCDNIVFPPSRAVLDPSQSLPIHGVAHVAMAAHPTCVEQLAALLQTSP